MDVYGLVIVIFVGRCLRDLIDFVGSVLGLKISETRCALRQDWFAQAMVHAFVSKTTNQYQSINVNWKLPTSSLIRKGLVSLRKKLMNTEEFFARFFLKFKAPNRLQSIVIYC